MQSIDTYIIRQDSLTVIDYRGVLLNGNSFVESRPTLGFHSIVGLVHSDKNITCKIEQGVNDSNGSPQYRTSKPFLIIAGQTIEVNEQIKGNFIRITLENNSGEDANVEAYVKKLPLNQGVSSSIERMENFLDFSFDTPLADGEIYTTQSGWYVDAPFIAGTIFTDQNGEFYAEFSRDGLNYDGQSVITPYTANEKVEFTFDIFNPYFKLIFRNNSGANQSVMRIRYGRCYKT
jgi:hypothetical protein